MQVTTSVQLAREVRRFVSVSELVANRLIVSKMHGLGKD
jgi:hypothetical protein